MATLLGMKEAGKRAGMTREAIRRSLVKEGVPLVRISDKALAVDAADLAGFIASRAGYSGKGRPRKDAATVLESETVGTLV